MSYSALFHSSVSMPACCLLLISVSRHCGEFDPPRVSNSGSFFSLFSLLELDVPNHVILTCSVELCNPGRNGASRTAQ
jgi:hypothetical protein